jgi:hypothetical protein
MKNSDKQKIGEFALGLKNLPRMRAPQGLADDVIRAVRADGQKAVPAARLAWKPALAIAAALLIAAGAFLFMQRRNRAMEQVAAKTVRFEAEFRDARTVALAGDFNKWDRKALVLQKDENGKWYIELTLKPGCYQYQFIVNGTQWTPDPQNPVKIDDGFGGINSGIEI